MTPRCRPSGLSPPDLAGSPVVEHLSVLGAEWRVVTGCWSLPPASAAREHDQNDQNERGEGWKKKGRKGPSQAEGHARSDLTAPVILGGSWKDGPNGGPPLASWDNRDLAPSRPRLSLRA
ncbi:hypothetical protein Dda_1637 [Drechslerella dactyloides]|uniref:Uncharacterized protein n=1 Tax=Drechslerella dactyloides TaxID=74499 RepID=A0AAD6NN96_DREDA|nr:hypothetical protein Dda_1637 [Drechslerella dactyloides]